MTQLVNTHSSNLDEIVAKPRLFGSATARAALGAEAEAYVARASQMISRARAIVQGDRVKALDLLEARRQTLCNHFGRYQRFKHGQIFNPIIDHAPASSKVVARSMKIDCIALGEIFAGYHSRWVGLRRDEWTAYRHDMLCTTEMMQANIAAEMRAIRQLLMISDIYAA
ncbi:MAG: hypothetical protein EOO77_38320 [Oxalobacteraceae bacterium]|nr:MAG: hypothetical protein EOO77_38320 [Oxalobacteraceae bacterium]